MSKRKKPFQCALSHSLAHNAKQTQNGKCNNNNIDKNRAMANTNRKLETNGSHAIVCVFVRYPCLYLCLYVQCACCLRTYRNNNKNKIHHQRKVLRASHQLYGFYLFMFRCLGLLRSIVDFLLSHVGFCIGSVMEKCSNMEIFVYIFG